MAFSIVWIFIKMLFRPYKNKHLFGLKKLPFVLEFISKERDIFVKSISKEVAAHILTPDFLAEELTGLLLSLDLHKTKKKFLNIVCESFDVKKCIQLVSNADSSLGAISSIKSAAHKYVPALMLYLSQNINKHPQVDEQLCQLLQKAIRLHFGMIAGVLIDSRKIYASIKKIAHEYLINECSISYVTKKIEGAIDSFFTNEQNWNKISKCLNDNHELAENIVKCIEYMLASIYEEQKESIIHFVKSFLFHVIRNVDVESMTERGINRLSAEEFKMILFSIIQRKLRLIMILSGVFGFILGCLMLLML